MIRFATLLTATAALALAACSSGDNDPAEQGGAASPTAEPATATPAATAGTPTIAMEYAAMAGAGDMYEIESSRLALEKGEREDVKTFAQMMIDHHTQSTQDLTAAAEAAGLMAPAPAMNAMQRDMISQLEGLSGAQFDAAYVAQQAEAHRMARDLHSTYAERGDTAQLRDAAGKIASVVQQHIAELQQISAP